MDTGISPAHDGLEGLNIDMATRQPRPAWRLTRQLFDYAGPELERHGDLGTVTVRWGRPREHGTGAARATGPAGRWRLGRGCGRLAGPHHRR